MNNNCPYRKQIEEKGILVCTPIGTSMLPLLRQRIDTVKLVRIDRPLKKYDVVLYQRPSGKYVLHRIVKVKKDKYNICGDNQIVIEKNVPSEWLIAVMDGFFREEEYIPVTNEKYIKYSIKRVKSRPNRYFKHKIKRLYEIIFTKNKKQQK